MWIAYSWLAAQRYRRKHKISTRIVQIVILITLVVSAFHIFSSFVIFSFGQAGRRINSQDNFFSFARNQRECPQPPYISDRHLSSLVNWVCNHRKNNSSADPVCNFTLRGTPPLLWSFPGSGNTWVRQLLEQATGITTGSVYSDSSLSDTLVSEGFCDDTSLVIKAHPTTHPFDLLSNHHLAVHHAKPPVAFQNFRNSIVQSPGDPFLRWDIFARRCRISTQNANIGGPTIPFLNFSRAIILDRHPLDAIFSELQRKYALRVGHGRNAHTYRLSRDVTQNPDQRTWKKLCHEFIALAKDYVLAWDSYVQFESHHGPGSILLIRYEDLKDENKRELALESMLTFLNVPSIVDPACVFHAGAANEMHRETSTSGPTPPGTSLSLSDFLETSYDGRPLLHVVWPLLSSISVMRGYDLIPGHHFSSSKANQSIQEAKSVEFISSLSGHYDNTFNYTVRDLGKASSIATYPLETPPTSVVTYSCIDVVTQSSKNGGIVLLFSTASGLAGRLDGNTGLLLNALVWLSRAGIEEVVVGTEDEIMAEMLQSKGVSTCLVERGGEIQQDKWKLIETMLRAGLDVVYAEENVIWKRNAVQYFRDTGTSRGVQAFKADGRGLREIQEMRRNRKREVKNLEWSGKTTSSSTGQECTGDQMVVKCGVVGESSQKIERRMRDAGLWVLRKDWRTSFGSSRYGSRWLENLS